MITLRLAQVCSKDLSIADLCLNNFDSLQLAGITIKIRPDRVSQKGGLLHQRGLGRNQGTKDEDCPDAALYPSGAGL